jgi:site-specific DNA recombinase
MLQGYKVAEVFIDRKVSGESMFERDGLLALMQAAKNRSFDAVIVESLSRLSRDQATCLRSTSGSSPTTSRS